MTDKAVLEYRHGKKYGSSVTYISKTANDFSGDIFTKTIDSAGKATYTIVPECLYITRTDLNVDGDLIVPAEHTLVICSKLTVTGTVTNNGKIRIMKTPGKKRSDSAKTIFPIFTYGSFTGNAVRVTPAAQTHLDASDAQIYAFHLENFGRNLLVANDAVDDAKQCVVDNPSALANAYQAAANAYRAAVFDYYHRHNTINVYDDSLVISANKAMVDAVNARDEYKSKHDSYNIVYRKGVDQKSSKQ